MSRAAMLLEISEFQDALAARQPGSLMSSEGQRLQENLERALRKYFAGLERAFPREKVLQYVREEIARLEAAYAQDADTIATQRNSARAVVEKMLAPYITEHTPYLAQTLGPHVAAGYWSAAFAVEEAARKGWRFFDLPIDRRAIAWGRAHGAGLVTGMNKVTQRRLAGTIADAMTQTRRGVPDVARAIRGEFQDMQTVRASTIANTEMNFAMSHGAFERNLSLGMRKKEWIVVGDERTCEICTGNGGAGAIPIEGDFPSGDTMTPGHVLCRCAIGYTGMTAKSAALGLSAKGRSSWLGAIGSGLAIAGIMAALARKEEQRPGSIVPVEEEEEEEGE